MMGIIILLGMAIYLGFWVLSFYLLKAAFVVAEVKHLQLVWERRIKQLVEDLND